MSRARFAVSRQGVGASSNQNIYTPSMGEAYREFRNSSSNISAMERGKYWNRFTYFRFLKKLDALRQRDPVKWLKVKVKMLKNRKLMAEAKAHHAWVMKHGV